MKQRCRTTPSESSVRSTGESSRATLWLFHCFPFWRGWPVRLKITCLRPTIGTNASSLSSQTSTVEETLQCEGDDGCRFHDTHLSWTGRCVVWLSVCLLFPFYPWRMPTIPIASRRMSGRGLIWLDRLAIDFRCRTADATTDRPIWAGKSPITLLPQARRRCDGTSRLIGETTTAMPGERSTTISIRNRGNRSVSVQDRSSIWNPTRAMSGRCQTRESRTERTCCSLGNKKSRIREWSPIRLFHMVQINRTFRLTNVAF